ncbi:MAG: PAS domain S-box protein [Acidobacteria bacterium]|nr:PAS domain S-box protein [Acidobacteriota bacterium]
MARPAGPGVWTWITVLGSVVLCGILSFIHIEQKTVVERSARLINGFRLARLDLTKGYLSMRLAENEGAAFDRLQALALLRQALDELQPAATHVDPDGRLDIEESDARRAFEGALAAFRKELDAIAPRGGAPGAAPIEPPGIEAAKRLSLRFHEAERTADVLDSVYQNDLRTLRSNLDREFAITLGIASLLLGAGCLGVWRAGREQARAAEALRESEERLRLLSDNLPDSYVYQYVREPGGVRRFLHVSAGVERIHGVTAAEVVREPAVLNSLIEADPTGAREAAEAASARDLSDFAMELRIRGRDARVRFVTLRSRPRLHPDGRVIWDGVATDVTERRLAEEALRESEERLRKVVATLSHGVVLCELTSRRLEWNPAALEILGLPPDLPDDSDLAALVKEYEVFSLDGMKVPVEGWPLSRLLRGEFLRDLELRVARLETSWERIFSFSGGVVPDARGRPLAVLSFTDVTERSKAGQELQRQRAELQVLFDLIPAMIWFKDTENRHLRVNQRVADAAGRTIAEIEGRPCAEIYPLEAEKYYADDLDVIRSRKPKLGLVERLHGAEGEVRWVQTDKVPYFDAAGNVIGIVVAAQDITERKRSEDALQEERERLRKVAATAPGVIHSFRLAPDGRASFPYASPRFEDVYGLTPEAVKNDASPIEALWHPDDAARIRESIEVSRRDLTPWQEEFRLLHPQKGQIWIEGHSMPVRDADGGTTWHGSLLDVTQRKKLEEQLRQAQKMEGVGQLASGIAHDFNNLLTVILGNAELLAGARGAGFEESVREIVEAAERAAGLTRQLLLFSRKQAMRAVDLDLNGIVAGMTRMLKRTLGEDVSLRTELSPVSSLVNADAGMIEQLVLNLAVNARDAMPRGGQLLISTREEVFDERRAGENPEAVPGTYLCLSVADSGQGIPPDALPHIFEPFFTTKDVGKGTGLGLATVYGIVKQHRGWIVTTSTVGAGTRFEVYLPAVAGDAAAQAAAPPTVLPARMPRGKETVLVVEDEPALRNLVKTILAGCGYEVLLAETGVQALEVWKEHGERVDLLLTDMVMPDGMSGRELAEALHRERPELPVVFTSGYSSELGRPGIPQGSQLALVEGLNFIQKPYAPKKLADLIRGRLDRPRI